MAIRPIVRCHTIPEVDRIWHLTKYLEKIRNFRGLDLQGLVSFSTLFYYIGGGLYFSFHFKVVRLLLAYYKP